MVRVAVAGVGVVVIARTVGLGRRRGVMRRLVGGRVARGLICRRQMLVGFAALSRTLLWSRLVELAELQRSLFGKSKCGIYRDLLGVGGYVMAARGARKWRVLNGDAGGRGPLNAPRLLV